MPVDFAISATAPEHARMNKVPLAEGGRCMGVLSQYKHDNRDAPLKMWECSDAEHITRAVRVNAAFGNKNLRDTIFKYTESKIEETPEGLRQTGVFEYPLVHESHPVWKLLSQKPELFLPPDIDAERFPAPIKNVKARALAPSLVDKVCNAIDAARKDAKTLKPCDITWQLRPTYAKAMEREIEGDISNVDPIDVHVQVHYYYTNPRGLLAPAPAATQ